MIHTSISGWSTGTFIEVTLLQDVARVHVESGVPVKKASAPNARKASEKTLANIMLFFVEGCRAEGESWRCGGRVVARPVFFFFEHKNVQSSVEVCVRIMVLI